MLQLLQPLHKHLSMFMIAAGGGARHGRSTSKADPAGFTTTSIVQQFVPYMPYQLLLHQITSALEAICSL